MDALEGIRVVDLTQRLAGPGTTMYLADYGAEVIKIEPRESGEAGRSGNPDPFYQGNSLSFVNLNRNKKSVTVDARTPEGREIVRKLATRSDVLVENFRPGVAKRLGLGYDDLARLNPRLVYASVSAYGTKGPYADKGGYDRILQGLGGLMYRRLPDGMPLTTGVYASDGGTPMVMAFGIMVALWVREKTGAGQKVDGSLLHTWLALQSGGVARAEKGPPVERDGSAATPGVFKCGDGVYINIAPNNPRQLATLARLVGLDRLVDDPSYRDPAVRARVRKEVFAAVEQHLLTDTAQEWLARIQAADVPSGPILEKADVFEEPQILENGMLAGMEHPALGRVTVTNTAVRLSATPAVIRTPAPALGEHTDEVLQWLGYAPGDIARLREQGVI